jgi:phosphoribosyl 1,2-cyclic phosphodiesterase
MEISVIASGSNGNCCLVEDKGVSVLIDAGKSCRETEQRICRLGKNLSEVKAIIISHSHHDHISGAGVISRKYDIPIYATDKVCSEAKLKLGNIKIKSFSISRSFDIGSMKIKPVHTSHNVSSCGFVIGKFGIFTDTGIVTRQMGLEIPKLNAMLLESNYDVDMLINGHYPAFLKQWILSNKGHLSNIDACGSIQKKGKNTSLVLLGHLSGNNNTPEAARNTFESLVKRKVQYAVCSRDNESGTWSL